MENTFKLVKTLQNSETPTWEKHPMDCEKEEVYLQAMLNRACKYPERPYIGYREISRETETSTRTFRKFLSYFLERAYVRRTQVGKYNKYTITEKGRDRLKQLIDIKAHTRSFADILASRRQDVLTVDYVDCDYIGHATVTGASTLWSDDDKRRIKEAVNVLFKRFQSDYPEGKFHIQMSIPPAAWEKNGSDDSSKRA